mmetsp:Transcript_25284/g.83052  ORF Transcript_25284/g.83052 Transcript_25284/m.83052 type:complete len:241 (-) Transcript_25284:2323-3045(-)
MKDTCIVVSGGRSSISSTRIVTSSYLMVRPSAQDASLSTDSGTPDQVGAGFNVACVRKLVKDGEAAHLVVGSNADGVKICAHCRRIARDVNDAVEAPEKLRDFRAESSAGRVHEYGPKLHVAERNVLQAIERLGPVEGARELLSRHASEMDVGNVVSLHVVLRHTDENLGDFRREAAAIEGGEGNGKVCVPAVHLDQVILRRRCAPRRALRKLFLLRAWPPLHTQRRSARAFGRHDTGPR